MFAATTVVTTIEHAYFVLLLLLCSRFPINRWPREPTPLVPLCCGLDYILREFRVWSRPLFFLHSHFGRLRGGRSTCS